MPKIKQPLLSFFASGRLANALAFRRHLGQNIAEKMPIPEDAKSLAQLSWRHMYLKAVALWHALSAAEQQDWESLARRKHMTGFAWFMSQALKPNPGLYLPLQGGTMTGDIDMSKNRILKLPLPTDAQEPATRAYLLALLNFLSLADTPAAYAGQALKTVRVNAVANALEFATLIGGYTEGARVYHNAHQAIPHGAVTTLAFNSERYDTDTIHDNVVNNSRLTCKTAGVYAIVFHGNFAVSGVGARQFVLNSNLQGNIGMVQLGLSAFNVFATSIATILDLAVDEFLYVEVYQNSGGPLNINSNAKYTPEFMMQRIG